MCAFSKLKMFIYFLFYYFLMKFIKMVSLSHNKNASDYFKNTEKIHVCTMNMNKI